jgi:Do/DeqQ family serine protease
MTKLFRSTSSALAALVLLFQMGGSPASAQERVAPTSREAVQLSFSPIVKTAAPAVVNVYVRGKTQVTQSPLFDDPFFRRFFGEQFGMPQERIQSSLGSGVIVSPEGLIVTNTHVVKIGAQAEIRIVLADKREYSAKVMSQDEKMDVAVLKIEGGDGHFPSLQFENSDTMEVGDIVLAIGNPFGVGQTVTQGIVSALARSEIGQSDAQVFIQTDAAINPGNSGGALVDMAGRLVGINTAIYSRSGGSHGIGFAIPSNLVKLIVDSAIAGRKVERPWIGAKIEPVTRDIAEGLGLDRSSGALVSRLYPNGSAGRAGIEPGDVIVAVDGYEVADPRGVNYRLTTRGIGNRSEVEVMRKGQRKKVSLELEAPPRAAKEDAKNLAGQHPFDGARVANLSPGNAEDLGVTEDSGVVVTQVRSGSIAARLGFRPGDVVVSIGDTQIDSVATLEQAIKQRQRVWKLAIKRGAQILRLDMPG